MNSQHPIFDKLYPDKFKDIAKAEGLSYSGSLCYSTQYDNDRCGMFCFTLAKALVTGKISLQQLTDKRHIAGVVSSEEVEANYAKHRGLFEPVQQLSRCELRRLNNASNDYCGVVDDDTAVLESSCGSGDDDFNLEPVLKTADLDRLKKELQNTNTSAEKQAAFAKCQNLRALCFAVSIRQKSGLFHPKNTTTTGNELVCLLNCPEYDELRRKICPDGAKVRMRDIRSYARRGTKSTSGYFLNMLDNNNEMFFSYAKNEHPTAPMLLFNAYIEQSRSAYSAPSCLQRVLNFFSFH